MIPSIKNIEYYFIATDYGEDTGLHNVTFMGRSTGKRMWKDEVIAGTSAARKIFSCDNRSGERLRHC